MSGIAPYMSTHVRRKAIEASEKGRESGKGKSDMKKLTMELVPEREGVRADGPTEMHVLVRLVPPHAETTTARPPLNIALVLDRSGSMMGEKLEAAKAAAVYAVRQLKEDDRLSVTIYDDEVQTIVPSVKATSAEKASAIRAIGRVQTGGSTALHAGWLEGGMQVSRHLERDRLNRVLLLTDGQANAGETNQDRICSDVNGLSKRGVGTSTLGVGDDFNEDLLEAMALSGDGNYHFISSANDLERIFASELHGLMATLGQTVSLGLEPQSVTEVVDVLNDLERNDLGRLMLPNLIAGNPIEILVKLRIDAAPDETPIGTTANIKPTRKKAPGKIDVCSFRAAWNAPGSQERLVLREGLSLPLVSSREWDALPIDERVASQATLMEVTRIRQRGVDKIAQGDIEGARVDFLCAMPMAAASGADWAKEESENLAELQRNLDAGEVAHAAKAAHSQNYLRRRSR